MCYKIKYTRVSELHPITTLVLPEFNFQELFCASGSSCFNEEEIPGEENWSCHSLGTVVWPVQVSLFCLYYRTVKCVPKYLLLTQNFNKLGNSYFFLSMFLASKSCEVIRYPLKMVIFLLYYADCHSSRGILFFLLSSKSLHLLKSLFWLFLISVGMLYRIQIHWHWEFCLYISLYL